MVCVPEIGFGELVGRMVWGTGRPDSVQGVVRSVDDGIEHLQRVTRHGFRTREETTDGVVVRIIGQDASWFWDAEENRMRVRRHESSLGEMFDHAPIGGLEVGGHRPSWERWEGSDFTRPASPVAEVDFLGRDCYTVELAPPSHKPYPIRVTVDALTGLVLRVENEGFGTVTEWASVRIGDDVPDDVFEWNGPAEPLPSHAAQQAERHTEWEADEARRRGWLEARGFSILSLPASTTISLHDWDEDTGAIYASVEAHFDGTLLRRPASRQYWDEPDTVHYEHDYRWSDERWDWYLASETSVSAEQLDRLRNELRRTT